MEREKRIAPFGKLWAGRSGCATNRKRGRTTHGSEDRRSNTGQSGRRRGAVVEVDDAVGEGFGGEEFEADGAVARLNQGDAFAD